MRYKWLNKVNNQKLIVFFNGWGMDDCVVKHLDCENYDVLMFYDYNNLEVDLSFSDLEVYKEKNIVAWSMGVMIATCLAPVLSFSDKNSKFTAINGTLKPIDSEFGIHPKIYDLTIKGFNERGRDKFVKSMFDSSLLPVDLLFRERELSEQLSELVALKNYRAKEGFEYTKVFISEDDKIIPTKSQVAFWGITPNLKGGHCPFFGFGKWSELL